VEERAARRLRLVPDEYDQVLRLDRFRQDYPAVVVGAGNGWWQAVIPKPDGEIVTIRYTLRALLDKLDELLNANPNKTPVSVPAQGCRRRWLELGVGWFTRSDGGGVVRIQSAVSVSGHPAQCCAGAACPRRRGISRKSRSSQPHGAAGVPSASRPITRSWSAVCDISSFGGQVAHELANPLHALGVEPVDRLVEDERPGVA
jgi:hypothetical protein